jgi:tetratricopeptide (TPR) repeat protein
MSFTKTSFWDKIEVAWRKNLQMSKKLISIAFSTLAMCSLLSAADPFYTNLLTEGKALYLEGKYDAALESFKIAEFGLIDEKEFAAELYQFYALAQYKKGAIKESQALLDKMKQVLTLAEIEKLPKPREIERDLSIMFRALKIQAQPGARPGEIAFLNLFYETWDKIKTKKTAEAASDLKRLGKMGGDPQRLAFLKGFLAFQEEDFRQCIKHLEKDVSRLDSEFSEDAFFYLSYSFLKGADLVNGEKYAKNIRNRDYIHRLMVLMDEIKAAQVAKSKKK